MKHKHNYRFLLVGLMAAIFASAVFLSCKDEDPSLSELRDDKISYLEDSLRVSDSLRRLNQAGVVNYAITVVSGSTSTLFKFNDIDRAQGTADLIEGALVTISQFGKTVTDTTDATGMVVFTGFFRGAVNVVVRKDNFTTAAFVTAVKVDNPTENGTINFVGNIIPIFETTGANTATISGVAKIQSDLTNTTRENVPDGTTLTANIDATDEDFWERFLTPYSALGGYLSEDEYQVIVLDGVVLEAAYSTNIVGTVQGGTYTITVPSAIDGLPIQLEYSDIAVDRKRFDITDDPNSTNRTITERALYGQTLGATNIPSAGGVDISFVTGTGAEAAARISEAGTIEAIDVIDGGDGFSGVPIVQILGGTGSGATATAVVTNGRISAVNVTAKGSGYNSASPPSVVFFTGSGAGAAVNTMGGDGRVLSVSVTDGGAGYTSAPTVTFSGGGAPTTPATGTAVISGGRVTAVNITNPGVGYTSPPTVGFTGGGFTSIAVANANYSGESVGSVVLTSTGGNYTYAPKVIFDEPDMINGTRATATVSFDPNSGTITGINLVNKGSGYLGAPGITIDAGGGAIAAVRMTGGPLAGIDVIAAGQDYTAAPTVLITGGGGSGAAATAAIVDGHVTSITLTNAGTGYTSDPTVTLLSGEGAQAVATVGDGGAISGIRVTTGGSGYTGAPKVVITPADGITGHGSGATATATIANGQVNGVTLITNGSGYVEGNTPGGDSSEGFQATYYSLWVKTALKYVNDVYWGSGNAQPN